MINVVDIDQLHAPGAVLRWGIAPPTSALPQIFFLQGYSSYASISCQKERSCIYVTFKIQQNAIPARVPPRTPAGELTTPQTP